MSIHGPSQVRLSTMAVILGALAVALGLGWLVLELADVLSWMFIAAFLALIFNPVVDRLSQWMPRWVALAALCLAAAGASVLTLVNVVPAFISQLIALLRSAPAIVSRLRESRLFWAIDERLQLLDYLQRELEQLPGYIPNIASAVAHAATSTARSLAALVSIFFATLFMLHSGPALVRRALDATRQPLRGSLERIAVPVYRAVTRYALGSLVIAAAAGLVALISLLVAGVPYFLPVGLAVAFLGLIPFIGATVSAFLLFGVTWAFTDLARGAIVLGVFLVYNQIENNVWQPLVHHRTVRLSPLAVLLAVLAGSELGGLVGIILAVPVAGALQIVLRELAAIRREAKVSVPAAGSTPSEPGG